MGRRTRKRPQIDVAITTPLRLFSGEQPKPRAPFDALREGVRSMLLSSASERRFERGETILRQGEEPEVFYVLLEGRAKMTRDLVAGRTVLLALFGPGDLFGTVAALARTPCDASIVALEPARALEITREYLFSLLAGNPRLIGELLPALTGHLAECRYCVVELTGSRVEERFATLFLRLADDAGESGDCGVLVPIRLSRQELADLAGTTIETTIRVLSRWHKSGVLETRDDGFLLLDRDRLEQVSRGAAKGRD